jgi:hypothetical protein
MPIDEPLTRVDLIELAKQDARAGTPTQPERQTPPPRAQQPTETPDEPEEPH